MKKLLLTLLMLVMATAAMSAQDELEQTPDPVFTIEEGENYVTVHIVCENAIIYVFADGVEMGTGYSEFDLTFAPQEEEQVREVMAYAQADGMAPSNTVSTYVVVPALPQYTSAPYIYFIEEEDQMTVVIENSDDSNATIYYRYFLESEGNSSNYYSDYNGPFSIPKQSFEEHLTIEAFAIADGKLESEHVWSDVYIAPANPPEPTSAPYIECVDEGYQMTVLIENSDDPDATIYYRCIFNYEDDLGNEFMVYDGPISFQRGDYYYFVIIEAYAIVEGKLESEHVLIELPIEPYDYPDPDPYQVSCYSFSDGGIYYKILSDSTVGVTRQYMDYRHYNYWVGDVLCSFGKEYPCYSGSITVPATVNNYGKTYTVTAIVDEAFMNDNVTSVTLPSTITEIGNYAFANSDINGITLPNSLTTIGTGAFTGCAYITDVNIPASVTTLGDYAYSRCEALNNVALNGSLSAIGKYSFSSCQNLTQVTIPATVTSIGANAFYSCKNLTDVSLSNGLETIGNAAFMGCSSLTEISLPATVTTIGNSVFSQCNNLAQLTLGNALTSIGSSAFSRCTSLTDIVIPEGVTTIGNSAFYGCKALVSASLPNALEAIDYSTFLGCAALSQVNWPTSLTSINYDAFNGCKSLPDVTIPAALTTIAARAFDDCPSLTSIQVEQGNTVFDSRENCNAIIETGSNTLILGCKNTVVPSTITAIGDHAFYNCADLTEVTIPDGVTRIGEYAFYNCKRLTKITIPATVDTICSDAFYTCVGLKTVTCLAPLPPVVYYRTFISCYDATLRVERESIGDYKVAEYWNQFRYILATTDPDVGDINGDGVITIADVTVLIDMMMNGEELPAYADFNGDGTVSIADVTALIDFMLGL